MARPLPLRRPHPLPPLRRSPLRPQEHPPDSRPKDSVIYGGFIHHINDTFAWSLYVRYNIEDGDLEETGGFFQYNLDCIAFRLNVDYLTSYTTDDGWKHDSDFRVSLGLWLRAFPHDEDEDWMDWASLADR